MTGAALVRLVRLSLAADRRGAMSSVFGIALGVSALTFFVALGLGVSRVVRERVFPVDVRLVEVVPSPLALGLLGGGRLDQAAVDRLAALPGVVRTFRKMTVRVPAVSMYDGDFFGRRLRMGIEVLAVGVDPDFVRSDVQLGDFRDPGEDAPIPAVAAARLLEIYNKSFAPARSLPQLSATLVVGFTFPVQLNRSFVAATPAGPSVRTQAQVVGVSERGLLAGITIPLDTAVRLNRRAGADADTFTGVVLQATGPAEVPALVTAVKDMGFRVDDQERRMAENVGAAVALTTSAMALLAVLICLVASLNIAHALSSAVRARERELAVMRAVGASRSDIALVILAHAGGLGLLGGLLGVIAAGGGALLVDGLAASALPPFPFKPESFFRLPPALIGVGLTVGLVSALAGAWFPARRAAAVDPARALAGTVP